MMKYLLLLCACVFFSAVCQAADYKEMTPSRVYHLMKEGSALWFIDVRSEKSYEKGHAEGAVNIPLTTLAHKRFPAEKILIAIDNSPGQVLSRKAFEILKINGQKHVYVLKGGLSGWAGEGLPMAGVDDPWELARVFQKELFEALQQGVDLQVYDLRSEDEVMKGMINGSVILSGETLENRLMNLRRQLQKRQRLLNLADQLEHSKTLLVVFPAAVSARDLYMEYLWGLQDNLRVLEGGYAAWDAVQSKGMIRSGKGCATCPGS
nr:rhodanese-like domain-containing protein [uncultured Desulfuromonas sp.]